MSQIPDTVFDGIPTDEPVIVAVSGGGDSIALLLLANVWAAKSGAQLQAVTVDHGLRPEAAHEAAFVASVCAGLGVPHVTLAWEGLKPSFGVQEAARRSRYSLMEDFAHDIGATVILTGHTIDDQAETVWMRMRRGGEGDGRGLAGMSRTTMLFADTRIIRPFLDISRKELRDTLRLFSQGWIEDPTNEDLSYERVQVRRFLTANPMLAEQALDLSDVSGRLRRQVAAQAAAFLRSNAKILPGPVFELALNRRHRLNPVSDLSVRVLLAVAGGNDYLASRLQIAALDEAVASGNRLRTTLGGAVCEHKNGILRFYRERRNLPSLVIDPGETAIWDSRLHVGNETGGPVFIEAASQALVSELETAREDKFAVSPRPALWATPVIHFQTGSGGNPQPALPLIEGAALPRGLTVRLAASAIEQFCPEFDFALREWVLSLDQHSAASLQP